MRHTEIPVPVETISAEEIRETMHAAIAQFEGFIEKAEELGSVREKSVENSAAITTNYRRDVAVFWERVIDKLLQRQGTTSEEAILTVALAAFDSSSMAKKPGSWILFSMAFTEGLESYRYFKYVKIDRSSNVL